MLKPQKDQRIRGIFSHTKVPLMRSRVFLSNPLNQTISPLGSLRVLFPRLSAAQDSERLFSKTFIVFLPNGLNPNEIAFPSLSFPPSPSFTMHTHTQKNPTFLRNLFGQFGLKKTELVQMKRTSWTSKT
jgi:hypothetical protein